jgi:hypothetical protein
MRKTNMRQPKAMPAVAPRLKGSFPGVGATGETGFPSMIVVGAGVLLPIVGNDVGVEVGVELLWRDRKLSV